MRTRRTVQLPPHVHCVRSRGKTYYYYHPNRGTAIAGPRVRIPGEPTNPDWWDAYREAAELPRPVARTDTFSALIKAYKASPEWAGMAESTQTEWSRYLTRVEAVWGDLQVRGIEPKHVLALRDKYAATPAAANNLLKALTGMLSWSVPRGWRKDNPCREVRYLDGGDPYEAWDRAEITLARQKLPLHLWIPICLAYYTGQRQSDVLDMGWNKIKGGMVEVLQQKTKKWVWIPLHRDLQAEIARVPRTSVKICTTSRGTPWACGRSYASSLALELKANDDLAPLRKRVFHGLRKSAVVALLEAGCSPAEVSAITGQTLQMVEHYARDINQKRLATSAIAKWEQAEAGIVKRLVKRERKPNNGGLS